MYGYCEEKIDVGHHWDLKDQKLRGAAACTQAIVFGYEEKGKTLLQVWLLT